MCLHTVPWSMESTLCGVRQDHTPDRHFHHSIRAGTVLSSAVSAGSGRQRRVCSPAAACAMVYRSCIWDVEVWNKTLPVQRFLNGLLHAPSYVSAFCSSGNGEIWVFTNPGPSVILISQFHSQAIDLEKQ